MNRQKIDDSQDVFFLRLVFCRDRMLDRMHLYPNTGPVASSSSVFPHTLATSPQPRVAEAAEPAEPNHRPWGVAIVRSLRTITARPGAAIVGSDGS